ncbi:MAG: hypothetical protein KAS71_19350, partial [Bacteroidales bacterium]|nr:hypothetical protein [Bacteroidales bacterium]
ADVHILSRRSSTGGGGSMYYLEFIGMGEFEDLVFEYEYVSSQSETDDERRKALLKLIKAGIIQYYSQAGLMDQIELDFNGNGNKMAVEPMDDPWNLWVFSLRAGIDFEMEESQNEYSFNSELGIEKVTEAWKTELEANYNIYYENYFDDGEEIVNKQNDTRVTYDYIRSLNPKWSTGLLSNYISRTYMNVKNNYGLSAGVEYNIFPWDISNRKVFTFRYEAGVSSYDYNEITIYNKMNEVLLFEALSLNFRFDQPWGSLETSIRGSHYFYDFSKNMLTIDSDFRVRLTKQLSIYGEIETRVIHDQLYLPIGDASLEDVLLERRKLATTYEISGDFGFRFTFGSKYNNVVNERF